MTTMPINNHPLQFICISVNKLTLRVLIQYNRQTTTTLLAALSAGTKT